MVRLNVHEAKTHLSRYLERVEQGETIILCRHNRPIAEIRPLPSVGPKPRVFGQDQGRLVIPREFSNRSMTTRSLISAGNAVEIPAGHVHVPVVERRSRATAAPRPAGVRLAGERALSECGFGLGDRRQVGVGKIDLAGGTVGLGTGPSRADRR